MSLCIEHKRPLHLFEGFGIELEYMIVDSETLNVRAISDKLLQKAAGKIVNEVSRGGIAWSNELVLHVIEFKSDGAAKTLSGAGPEFQKEAESACIMLQEFNAMLMPGGIHPWMDPHNGVALWPHEYNPIYESYNRIFDCRGHGWANLQSTHLNLPFYGDDEFEKLHAALRVLLPLIPAMAASSPIAESQKQSFLDFRMEAYRTNSIKIPSITGLIVPEAIFSQEEYTEKILQAMYREISEHDRDGILQEEWLNSRGLMPRWDRNAIEIRVIDTQESPESDIAILEWITSAAKRLAGEEWSPLHDQKNWSEQELYPILLSTIRDGEEAQIDNSRYLQLFGLHQHSVKAGDLCRHIYQISDIENDFSPTSAELLDIIFREGPLGRRILRSLPDSFDHHDLVNTYRKLCFCLRDGKPFLV